MNISDILPKFSKAPFISVLKEFFKSLNVPVNYIAYEPARPSDILGDKYKPSDSAHKLMDDVYLLGIVNDAIFQGKNTFNSIEQVKTRIKSDYDGILIFGVTLKPRDSNLPPARSQLAEITRAFNRTFHYTPVVIVFKYGKYIAFSSSERLKYKQEWREGEKVGKISLLRDINISKPHTGHLKILQELTIKTDGKDAVTNFDGLYKYWQNVFNVSLINKIFFKDLFNWYCWALKKVEFPNAPVKTREQTDKEYKEKLASHKAVNVIRLITRLMFVWFLKEKKVDGKPLIPDEIFDNDYLNNLLEYKDKTGSTYYKAILQNLFFATLNTEMEKDSPGSRKFVNRQTGVQVFLRYARFFKDEQKALELFRNIPFLNGGLFENLDKNVGKDDEIRIDCFSNSPKNEELLKVPDDLFFGIEENLDLSEVYEDKKHNHEKTLGLIKLLNSYKFTIDENTPLEEDIALDPELLGKVFENLLASYNPETQSTARKQTGSFYTPREIVNYMVDESLIAYLENKLTEYHDNRSITKTNPAQVDIFGNTPPQQTFINIEAKTMNLEDKEVINNKLRDLLSYTETRHLFSEEQTNILLKALNECKILDPACGSGAFPMGILHKMVLAIHKLDPDNEKFKKMQISKAEAEINDDIKKANEINDDKARESAIKELQDRKNNINDAFDNNDLDYARKLYLIENCIFGIDIQPIAVQIAKLRFFISLIVDQKIDYDKPNMGIRPLPNLETKFVAANTLIGINKSKKDEQMAFSFENPEITRRKNELKKIREKHFEARTTKTKQKYRDFDQQLRKELSELLKKENSSLTQDETLKLANWNPYDQNASSEFFDMEWMFGLKDGFNVVIGNPPYINSNDLDSLYKNLKQKLISSNYYTLYQKWDIYIAFLEKSLNLLNKNGFVSIIIPYPYIDQMYAKKSREHILKNFTLISIADLSNIMIFENATVNNCILLIKNLKNISQKIDILEFNPKNKYFFKRCDLSNQEIILNKDSFIWQLHNDIKVKIKVDFEELGNICFISKGMVLNSDETIAKNLFKKEDLISKDKSFINNTIYTEAKYIDKYIIKNTLWLEWNSERVPRLISRATFNELYLGSKILINKLGVIKATLDKKEIICDQTIRILKLWKDLKGVYNKSINKSLINNNSGQKRELLEQKSKKYDLKFLLSIINSKICNYYLNLIRGLHNKDINPEYLRKIPIPKISLEEQKTFIELVEQILENKKSREDTQNLEDKIDLMVYKLYDLTYNEVKIVDPDFKLSEQEYVDFVY